MTHTQLQKKYKQLKSEYRSLDQYNDELLRENDKATELLHAIYEDGVSEDLIARVESFLSEENGNGQERS